MVAKSFLSCLPKCLEDYYYMKPGGTNSCTVTLLTMQQQACRVTLQKGVLILHIDHSTIAFLVLS